MWQHFIPILSIILGFAPVMDIGAAESFKLLIVDSQTTDPYQTVRESLLAELPKLGYTPDENLTVTYYSIGNIVGQAKRIWRRERNNQYPVIFVNGTMATTAFKDLALDTPQSFVFAAVTDPVGVGVIEDFTNPPAHNFTGVCYPVPVAERLRFIRHIMPGARKIALIYADMPQSHSYRRWLETLLSSEAEFSDLEIVFRQVSFVKTEQGYKRMVQEAKAQVEALTGEVDVFLTPNDQMGVQRDFAEMVYATADKPLVGLGRKDVMEGWGAAMTIYASQAAAGRQVAHMIHRRFQGTPVKEIIPEWPAETGVAFDLAKMQAFGLAVPPALLEKAGNDVVK